MPPSLLAPDRQDTWTPVWYFTGSAWPDAYSTRDIDIPGAVAPGDPFVVGDSEVGGGELVGGGAGTILRQAYARILNTPTITRRLADVAAFGRSVEVSDVTVDLANTDGALSGNYRGATFTLTAYDPLSGFLLEEGQFIVSNSVRNRGTFTIEGTSLNPGIPEDPIPKGVIDTVSTPLAVDIGLSDNWIFGNVVNVPLRYVRDDRTESQFDYRVCRGTSAAITAIRRVTPNGATPFVTLGDAPDYTNGYTELEPYPGMVGVLRNGNMESWPSGVSVAPEFWVLGGAGATVAKNTTAGQFDEGTASASLTWVGADCDLTQDLVANAPMPLSWWQGRAVTLNVRVRATVAFRALIAINDGVGESDSPLLHSGSGLFELQAVTRTIDAAATRVWIRCFVVGGATTAQFDDVRVYLQAKSWEEVGRTDLYPGYTAVRFFFRQEDASGALHQIVADVNGLQPERNPVRAARTMLSDPTHGLGRATDVASFDQAEIDATFDYDGAVLLDAPLVYLPFSDAASTLVLGAVAYDASGHARHGSYHPITGFEIVSPGGFQAGSGGHGFLDLSSNAGSWVDLPHNEDYNTQSPAIDGWYRVATLGVKCAIVEKTIGEVTRTQYGMEQSAANAILFFVKPAASAMVSVSVPITGADVGAWIHLIGQASGGVLTLTINTTRTDADVYPGAIATGDGKIFIGKFGSGATGATASTAGYDSFALYPAPLSGPRAIAHYAGRLFNPDAVPDFEDAVAALTPFLWYKMTEVSVLGGMVDSGFGGQTNGTYVGSPKNNQQPGPLNPLRNRRSGNGAVRFLNRISDYGLKTGLTLNAGAQSVIALYRPAALLVAAGIAEKTVAGATATQWLVTQGGTTGQSIVFQCVNTGSAAYQVSFDLTPEDVGRVMLLVCTFDGTELAIYKNGVLQQTAPFAGTLKTGVGDLYVGKLGSNTAPGYGDISHVVWVNANALTAQEVADLWPAATWYPGGLRVDLAMTEARDAQDQLKQVTQLRSIRFDFTATGAITCAVDAVAPTTILMEARDGAGDGERTLLDCRDRQRPALADAVRDLVVNYRRDLLSGAYLRQFVRPISTALDAQGNRIGSDRIFNLDGVREDPSADRFASYMAALLTLDETVSVTLGPEARALREGMLVQLTDANMGYADDVLVAQEVTQVFAGASEAVLREWDESIYVYAPAAFQVGATSG